MITLETLLTFFGVSLLLALAPGPDNIFVLTQSALHGKGAGIAVMLGLCSGLIGHSMAVALGVAAIIQTSAIAFTTLKFIGVGYLVYLAWKAFSATTGNIQGTAAGDINYRKLYCRGVIMNITNPKVTIFFLAFLPQFADPSRGSIVLQILMLSSLFILATILIFGGIALLAGRLGEWMNQSNRAQKILNKVAGSVFLGLAFKLATAKP